VDVGGAFAVVTGDHIALEDGVRFNAAPGPSDDLLTSAPPAAFGFLPGNPGPIEIDGPILSGAAGKSVALIGGAVKMSNATLSSTGGVVIRAGRLTMADSSIEATATAPAHKVSIKARREIALTAQPGASTRISVTAKDDVGLAPVLDLAAPTISLSGSGSGLVSAAEGEVRAGSLRVEATDLSVFDGAFVSADTVGAGAGADVFISTRNLRMRGTPESVSQISSLTASSGAGGNLTLEISGDASLREQSNITTTAFADGAAGRVELTIGGRLTVAADSQISSDTFGLGDAGDVTVRARSVLVDGEGSSGFTAISAEAQFFSLGRGGDVRLAVSGPVVVTGGGRITAGTFGDGPGGNVDITAGSLRVFGTGSTTLDALGRAYSDISVQSESPTAGGRAGDLRANVSGALELIAGGKITATTTGPGAGGSAMLTAGRLFITGRGSEITAETTAEFGGGAPGAGGDVFVRAGAISIVGRPGHDVGISTRSLGAGRSGSISLEAGTLDLESSAVVASSNTGSGNAGSVSVQTSGGIFLDTASVITTAAARGDAGLIRLQSGSRIDLRERSRVTASAGRNGGSIELRTRDVLHLIDSEITATAGTVLAANASGAGGSGGNIFIDPTFVILDHSLISANAAIGRGGNIEIISDFFFNNASLITATGAVAGTITISAPELDLSAGLIDLPSGLVDASTFLREQCARRLTDDFSSFLLLGRGGVSESPEDAASDSGAAQRKRKKKVK
jgi:hypothetical protein